MRCLVTGASGFVGPHLVAHLQDLGDEVVATDRHTGLDINEPDSLRDVFASVRPEVIYHLAGDSDVGGSWNHPLDTFRANAEGTLNVLDAARASGVRRVISIGSADVYGKVLESELPITEQSELRPTSPYAASKVAADYLGLQAFLGYGLEVIRVRAFNHLGPGQSDRFVAPAIALRVATNEVTGGNVVPVGNLDARRDISDVRDVVRAYRLLAEFGTAGAVYNVCSGTAVRIGDLAEQLVTMASTPMALETDPALLRPVDIPVLCGDNSKLREDTGWEPKFPIDVTLADLMADCRSRVASASLG
ncbi:MAG TPA: GDP-mannose 4,6-dehydratase [Microthrixaceae bacterium]|nr:GDP-mannose 4,6-dehydratase [Microthrixaceae bacterium]